MKVNLRKWLFSLIALAGFVVAFNTTGAFAQAGSGIDDMTLTNLEECVVDVKTTQVNITTPNYDQLLAAWEDEECNPLNALTFDLIADEGYLYYPNGFGLNYNADPSTWIDALMTSGSSDLNGGGCIALNDDDHDQGQFGIQVWVWYWNGENGNDQVKKKYQIDIRPCVNDGDDDNSLTDLTIDGLFHCVDGDMDQPVVEQLSEETFEVHLPDWADGMVEFTLDWTIAETASSSPEAPYMITFDGETSMEITVFAENGELAVYTLNIIWDVTDLNDENQLTAFWFVYNNLLDVPVEYEGVIDEEAKQVAVTVPFGVDVEHMLAYFELSEGAVMTHSEDTPQLMVSGDSPTLDYTTPVAFTVHAEDCTPVEYFVTVTVAENCCNDILTLSVDGVSADCYADDFVVSEDFQLGAENVWEVTVPYGTALAGLDFSGTLSEGAGMDPDFDEMPVPVDGVAIPVTVTAANGVSTQNYTIIVNVEEPSTEHELLAFWFVLGETEFEGTVDQETHRVDVVLPYGTPLTDLAACFEVSEHACFYINGPGETDFELQWTCETENDFTDPRHFTVVAEDGETEDNYNVVVTLMDPDTENWLMDLAVSGTEDCFENTLEPTLTQDGNVYTIRLRENMDEDVDLDVTFVIPDLATSSPVSPATVSFSEDAEEVEITVTAENGEPAVYTLVADFVPMSDKKAITEFTFAPYVEGEGGNMQFTFAYMGTIDEDAKTVTVHVPHGTNVTALKASFILDDMYAAMTHSEENSDEQVVQLSGMSALDYTTPVAFTVYDEACNTVEYFVTVIIDENEGNEINEFVVDATESADCECGDENDVHGMVSMEGMDITVTLPYGTDMDNIVVSGELAEGATSDPTWEEIDADTEEIVVTAEDGLATKTYTLTFVMADPLEGNDLITFGFTQELNPSMDVEEAWGVIDQVRRRIDVSVPYGTDVMNMVASFTNSPMSCVFINGPEVTDHLEQCSGVTPNDFSDYIEYTVIAQSGDESYYNIYVEVLPPDTDNTLSGLMAYGLPECFGDYTYDVSGMMDGMDVVLKVKEGTDVSSVEVDFDIPAKATVDPMPGAWDLTSPVEVTVTAQSGDEAVYTVSVEFFTPSAEKDLKSIWFTFGSQKANGAYLGDNVFEVWVPWLTDVSDLVAEFTLSAGARMTHSEDTWVLQVSGETPNDFTYPVAYTVWGEDCTTEEYFVIVHVTPNTETGISQFVIDYDGCGCDLGVKVDEYAKRIYVRIPYADADGNPVSLASIAPSIIGLADGATVSPAAGVAKNFAGGPVVYTVTAPDGVTKQTWSVMVENPPCVGTDINSFALDSDKVVSTDIDADNHMITVVVEPNTDISAMSYEVTLDCGATICCNAGACAGQVIDFSGGDNCHVCVVTAQDKSVEQEWTICIVEDDVVAPDAYTNSVLVHNCDESVDVWASEAGTVYIIHEMFVGADGQPTDDLGDIVDDHYGASASYPYADSVVSVSTAGIYKGKYYAFAVDASGNVSCASEEAFYVDVCVVEVANMCDLRNGSEVYEYVVTGEVFVTYEEGNFKFIQDANCGIKVVDELGSWPSAYGRGTGLTNIKGTIDKSGNEYVFTPVCCYSPEKSSTGNVVAPVELTWDGFVANCYSHGHGYESMLVKITTPMLAFDDYGFEGAENWLYNFYDLATVNAKGDYEWFIQQVFNANYIGDEIPTEPTIYQGIRTNVWWGAIYGLLTPRDRDDIIKVTAGDLIADPNPAEINGILAGLCGTVNIDIINQGVGNLNITALYLDDAAGSDEFELINPPMVPFTLGTWDDMGVRVDFCPNDIGAESTTLLVEFGDGKVLEVPINGTTAVIYDMDYCQDFNSSPTGDALPSGGWTGDSPYNSSLYIANVPGWFPTVDGTNMMYMRNRQSGRPPVELVSPGINVTGTDPVVTWTEIAHTGFNGGGNSSPRNLYITTDGVNWTLVDSYLTSEMPDAAQGDDYRNKVYSLADYVGHTIWWKFELISANNNEYIYWAIDNFCVQERVTEPILKHAPDPVDLGGVQLGESASQTISFTNVGISVAKVKSIAIVSSDGAWTLTDDNTYPTEITDGDWAYAENGTDELSVDVTFAPTDIGVSTAKLVVTWGMYSDMVYEVPMTGEGLSCLTATEAFVGENWAASQNSWFTYTAEKFQIVYINSCHPFNTTDPYEYSFDTWLYVYDDCDGTLRAQNDDLEWDACPYNRASSGVTFAMNEGETVKIFWPWEFSSTNDDIGFYFNIEPNYPTDGDVCETAIPLTLPVVNHFGSTVEFADDYDMSPCSPFSNYMDGNDKVYSISLEYEGYLTGSILGAYGSIHVLDKCPVEELEKRNCKAFASGPNGGDFEKRIQPGDYYVIVSTWAPPQTVDYLLNMSFRGLGVDSDALNSTLKVYPNPTDGMFTVSITNAEAADMTLELVNISGQTVYRNQVKAVYSYNEQIDASAFAKGVYYLKVNDGENVKIEKIVVQ